MKLLGIIVNYRTARMTLRAAEMLLQELSSIGSARIAIVDNHSRDGSFEQLRDAVVQRGWQRRVEVLQTGYNGGFGYGNNYAIRRNLASNDRADYFYLLNSDAFPQRDAIAELLGFLERHRYVGIAGSHIEGPDGVPHHTAFRFPSLLGELESGLSLGVVSKWLRDWTVALPIPEAIARVDWIAGASMLIRREVLEKVGLFDEHFFLYFEETDLCRRAQLAGFPIYYLPKSVVVHIGSASTGMKDETRPMPRYWFESRRHYFHKHHGFAYLQGVNLAWTAGHVLWQARRFLQHKRNPHPPWFLRDFIRYNFIPTLHTQDRAKLGTAQP
jgi:N-acetylglucosaminyl-diphospho-decaprenol L-rhamnosyltransferase